MMDPNIDQTTDEIIAIENDIRGQDNVAIKENQEAGTQSDVGTQATLQQTTQKKWAKGYVDLTTCTDGKDSHAWEDTTMNEDGIEFPVTHCSKCGYWN